MCFEYFITGDGKLWPVFVNKVSLEHSPAHLFIRFLWWFSCYSGRVVWLGQRPCGLQKEKKKLTICLFMENVCLLLLYCNLLFVYYYLSQKFCIHSILSTFFFIDFGFYVSYIRRSFLSWVNKNTSYFLVKFLWLFLLHLCFFIHQDFLI